MSNVLSRMPTTWPVSIESRSERTRRSFEGERLPLAIRVLRAADARRRVDPDPVEHLLVVEAMAQGVEVLLLAEGRERVAVLVDQVLLDIIAARERCDLAQLQPAHPASCQESIHSVLVGFPGVGVA